ncbi:hypothetical protein EYF80_038515 [Liparis tanakae]|uniref:Uncharacterized protein n=1 Tax=Liparis tanakae TaxID=230148 RepID=A0A4Z2GCK8_9TELE|nr:hypothetical protein EYF80_038515 [Liparis tanakae]
MFSAGRNNLVLYVLECEPTESCGVEAGGGCYEEPDWCDRRMKTGDKASAVSPHLLLMCSPVQVQVLPAGLKRDDSTVVTSCQHYGGAAIKRSITARPRPKNTDGSQPEFTDK